MGLCPCFGSHRKDRPNYLCNYLDSANPRLILSFQHLNESVEDFEKIYSNHVTRHSRYEELGKILLKALDENSFADSVEKAAATLQLKIDEFYHAEKSRKKILRRWDGVCKFLTKLFPMIRVCMEVGGSVTPVRCPFRSG